MRISNWIIALLILPAVSASAARVMDGQENYWRCVVYDSSSKHWTVQDSYQRSALNKAYTACKKQSQNPASCKAARENCDAYIDGLTTSPMWRCMALDFFANPFYSHVYKRKTDAALAARSYCEHNSQHPESCYIHLFTCSNLNSRDL